MVAMRLWVMIAQDATATLSWCRKCRDDNYYTDQPMLALVRLFATHYGYGASFTYDSFAMTTTLRCHVMLRCWSTLHGVSRLGAEHIRN